MNYNEELNKISQKISELADQRDLISEEMEKLWKQKSEILEKAITEKGLK